ncbi:hypothetical protein SMKI_04G3940 [Saccharomyces mikatae IFO 1815]|uniref:Csn9p n=1 Tax=Saccharomyces mikatae IFO 1815 TaxID=226126 RepID=A0AA35NHC3_SACMI|nr:uncharacterized protein SMKI_04G3940 [Saccharomyces mikatae IFO 1815]CAI4038055.1 hypothetical protein SMKI_04G3940 [Saccharomyces mikatae IFO 1815]
MREEIIKTLEDFHKYHYKEEWLNSKDLDERQLLEIFAFGNVEDLPKNIRLTPPMRSKLERLTLITLSEKYNELSYEMVRQECQIEDNGIIEGHLIELQDILKAEMDSVNEFIKILNRFDCRDVYCCERELIVVKKPRVTKEYLVHNLHSWEINLKQNILE